MDDCERFICVTQEFCRRFDNGMFDEKRELFKLVCSNVTLKDGSVACSYAEPFKTMMEFALVSADAFERQERLPVKQEASLVQRWRS